MLVGVPRESLPGELRVALVPQTLPRLTRKGLMVRVQPGAGQDAGFADADYVAQGAQLDENVWDADVVVKVQPASVEEIVRAKPGSIWVGGMDPFRNGAGLESFANKGVTALAMELMPRITRAQPMDMLSAMSTVAGYKAVLLAADRLPRFFPLLMTAAGTINPAHVLVLGAGVAGLQAIATARRLGAVVEAYDTRPAVREQVESLGARFVSLDLDTHDAEDAAGYARSQGEEFYQKQRAGLHKHIAAADVVITTALIPGKPAPRLITEEAVRDMAAGSIIVDLAAEHGGNCELTEAGQEVRKHGVLLIGPVNLPSTVPYHASQMFAHTVSSLLLYLNKDGTIAIDPADEIVNAILVCHEGKVLFSH